MAGSALLVSSGSVVLGGLGSLPERRAWPCSNAVSASGFLPQSGAKSGVLLRQRASGNGGRGRKVHKRRSLVVSQRGDLGEVDDSKVFKSMKSAAERRKEETYGTLDDVEIAEVLADVYRSRSVGTRNKPVQPPRFATLRAFGEAGGEGVVTGFGGTSVFELLAASIEATKQVRNWEVLSGRLAMLALSVAIGVEFFTGNSVFEGVNLSELQGVGALCAVATLSAGAFAYAWKAKEDVVYLMSKNYKNMVDSALDNLIDGLFFDESKHLSGRYLLGRIQRDLHPRLKKLVDDKIQAKRGPIPITVFSFGGSSVRNDAIRNRMVVLGVRGLQVVNKHDVVPRVPGINQFNGTLGFLEEKLKPI